MTVTSPPDLISVIITTYNATAELEKVLLGYSLQSFDRFELVIADDGSNQGTADLIEKYRQTTTLAIQHVWHEDNGFRKCEILNRAIEAADGDYLLFTDGDCIPRADFVEVHHTLARHGQFLSGTYNTVPESFGVKIDAACIQSGQAFDWKWLRSQGLPWSRKCLRLIKNRVAIAILNGLTTTRPTWNGCNVSGWKSDLVAANGFDERMKYGGLDRELGLRLNNAGVRGKQIRFKAICLHVDHPRGYANQDDLDRNLQIRKDTIRDSSTFAVHGIRNAA